MAKASNTIFAVLGLLTKGSYSGYEIRKHFSGSLHHFWSESYGQIYPVLKELVAKGYAEEVDMSNPSRGQKKYAITPEGRDHFRSWLAAPVGALNYRDELLLKVFFATHQDSEAIIALLEQERLELNQAKEVYLEQKRSLLPLNPPDEPPLWILSLNYGIQSTEARLKWCTESIEWLHQIRQGGRQSESE